MVPCQLSWPRTFCTGGKPCRQQPLFPHEYTQTCAISSSNMVHKRRNGGSSSLQHFLKHPEQPQSDMHLFMYIKGVWAQPKLNNLSYLCGAVPDIELKHQCWIWRHFQNSHGDFEPLFIPSVVLFFPLLQDSSISTLHLNPFWDKNGTKRNTDEHNHCSVLMKAAVTLVPFALSCRLLSYTVLLTSFAWVEDTHTANTHAFCKLRS